MTWTPGKRSLAYALIATFVLLLILSAVLPYVGGGHSGSYSSFH